MALDTLFFDGQCSLCAGEMKLLKRLKRDDLALIDIHQDGIHREIGQLKKDDLLKILHLRKANGIWLMGVDASIAAWRHTHFGFLLLPLRWPFIKPLADKAYLRWAEKRACRLGYSSHCELN